MRKSIIALNLRLAVFGLGIACLFMGACAESGTERKKFETSQSKGNEGNNEGATGNQAGGGNNSQSTDGNGSSIAGLSLAEQCAAQGEGFIYSESEESCFKIIEKKTSEEVCQTVSKEFIVDNGSCASVSKKQKLSDLCSEKGANYKYNADDDSCYEVVGTPSTIEQLCADSGSLVDYDAELELCQVFSSVQDFAALCTDAGGTPSASDAAACVVNDTNKSLTDLCNDKGAGYFLFPSVEAPVSCNAVSQILPANAICLSQGEQNHIFNQATGACETVNDQQASQAVCDALGINWNPSNETDECIEFTGEQALTDLCKGPSIRCLYLDNEELWGIISDETTAKSLCEARGSDFKFNEKGQCEHKDGEVILKDGTRVLKDGTKILPDGTKILPDGTKILPDGTRILPDGTKVFPDGTQVKPDGTVLDKDGNPIERDENGNVTLPDGSVVSADGTVTKPDGTVISPDGTITLPDGTKILPDGTTILPDGTTIDPDGKTTLPDGTERKPGDTAGAGGDEILENGKPKLYSVTVAAIWHTGKGRRYAQSNAHYSRVLDTYDNYYGDKSSHPKDYWGGPYQKVETIELKCPAGYRVRQIEAERTYVVTETKVGEFINWISLTCVNLDKVTREVSRRAGYNVTGQTSTIACTGTEVPTGLGSATISWLAKNFELECAPFNQFEVESGEKNVNFVPGERLFTGKRLFNNDGFGERRFENSCNNYYIKNRVLTGLKFAVDKSDRAGDYWVPLWFDPLCSELQVNPN